MMSKAPDMMLRVAYVIVVIELLLLIVYRHDVCVWVSHYWWVLVLPFSKLIVKKLLILKFALFLKALAVLVAHLIKLLFVKLIKTLVIRYGVFFTQGKWRWARWAKVMFLRRGSQFFRIASHYWSPFSLFERIIISVAFFPIIIVVLLLKFGFVVTYQALVNKQQETNVIKGHLQEGSKGRLLSWVTKMDQKVLEKINAYSKV